MLVEHSEKRVVERNRYEYFCDICGKLIGESYECDDGYIPTPFGVFNTRIKENFFDQYMLYEGNMCCEECFLREKERIYGELERIGFKKLVGNMYGVLNV